MPIYGTRCGVYPANGTAGTEVSSTYEGRHLSFLESELTHPSHTDSLVDKGDPVVLGEIVGVSFKSAVAATDYIAIDTEGVWNLSVVATNQDGNTAVAAGQQLYINRTTCIISKNADEDTHVPFGYALGAVTSGQTAVIAVKVHFDPAHEMLTAAPDNALWVSKLGNDTYGDGSIGNMYATITKALTLVTAARNVIYVMPGEYAEAATLTWPNFNGLKIIGLDWCGNVVISNANAAAQVLLINPTFTSASFEAFLENVCIEHDAQVGIQINNTGMGTRKLIIHLKNVSTSQVSTGDSIDVLHGTAGQAIRIYAEGCDEIEGLVDIDGATADDRFRFKNCTLIGGITEVGAVAGEFTLMNCVVLASGLTVDAAMVLTYVGNVYRTDAGVYTEFVNAYST